MTALLVTIHDVAPPLMPKVRRLWDVCALRGVRPGLLVVPEWHGAWPIERDPDCVGWVRDRAAEGAEVFLHGERHDEVGSPRGWRDRVRAFGRTNREGEFLTLGYDAARARIDRGLARLRALGLDPIGFVPPAWLARADGHRAVREAGLAVSEDDGTIYAFRSRRVIPSPVVRWSSRGAFRAYGSLVQAALRWRLQRHASVLRIALHPADLDHPATAASVERELDRWLGIGPAVGYASL
ncbi:MAG TPA: polysaccharide deacetylase family protein [Gemmatimonadaceae bacterium]|nr:polysaccharide deacetylase family protein [Gemmatimonadaceae bacterium]